MDAIQARTEDELQRLALNGLLEETHWLDLKRELGSGNAANKDLAKDIAGCVNPIWDHDDGLTGTHLAPANHALGLGGHCRVARAIGICRPDRGYRFRALGGLHRRGAQPRCREVL